MKNELNFALRAEHMRNDNYVKIIAKSSGEKTELSDLKLSDLIVAIMYMINPFLSGSTEKALKYVKNIGVNTEIISKAIISLDEDVLGTIVMLDDITFKKIDIDNDIKSAFLDEIIQYLKFTNTDYITLAIDGKEEEVLYFKERDFNIIYQEDNKLVMGRFI